MTFSGHGGRFPDLGGDEGADGVDETLCLFDRELLDDELFIEWCEFSAVVRIVMLADSCHSGTVHRGGGQLPADVRWRGVRRASQSAILRRHREQYVAVARQTAARRRGTRLRAHVLLLAACADDERAAEGRTHGLLTEAVLGVAPGARHYDDLLDGCRLRLRGIQTPRLVTANWPVMLSATAPLTP